MTEKTSLLPHRPATTVSEVADPSLIQVDGILSHAGVPESYVDWERVVDDMRDKRTMRILGTALSFTREEPGS